MSYYAVFDDEQESGGDVATISGWADFRASVESTEDLSGQLLKLVTVGYNEDLSRLKEDLDDFLVLGDYTPDVFDIAEGLLRLIKTAGRDARVVIISDGTSPAE